ncbi:CpsD/CapB family tyrosine-protein kinase [Paenibacillus gansuensis]|uniref:non-specific protein-tyrosine kinase n=1 Tax=Paenibacillus gansuensis TaxID=306542 RepID=A0ABW5PGR9_9BACL
MVLKAGGITVRRSLTVYHNPQSSAAEQYRSIRNNIQFFSENHKVRSMVVTSPGTGEGKTTTACNLALSIAARGERVLLIDADFKTPTMHLTFNVPNTGGLTSVLIGKLSLAEAMYPSDIPGLDILPSGPVGMRSAELITSQGISFLLQRAKEKYDTVIIDGPPVLISSDAAVLANLCGGVIFVVQRGKTQKEAASEAKRTLERVKANILGVVVNKK